MLVEAELPDDLTLLQAMLVEAHGEIIARDQEITTLRVVGAQADAEIERLTDIIAALQRHRFGARSEQLSEDQLGLALEETEALARVAAKLESVTPDREPKRRNVNRSRLPAHLERVLDPGRDVQRPDFAKGSHVTNLAPGQEVSRRPHIGFARVRVPNRGGEKLPGSGAAPAARPWRPRQEVRGGERRTSWFTGAPPTSDRHNTARVRSAKPLSIFARAGGWSDCGRHVASRGTDAIWGLARPAR